MRTGFTQTASVSGLVLLLGMAGLASTGEAAAPCRFAVSPTTADVAAESGSGTFTLSTGSGCRWRITVDGPFLAVDSASGTGSATITYRYSENTGPGRTGKILVKNAALVVNQAGAPVVEPPPVNEPPTANAGAPQVVPGGSVVTLDGTASSDPEGQPLAYAWTQTGGPTVALADATTARPSFTAPAAIDQAQPLAFQLVVNDGAQDSAPATANVTVAEADPGTPSDSSELSNAEDIAAAFATSGTYTIVPGTYVGNFVISGSNITVTAEGVRFEPEDPYSPALTVLGNGIRVVGLTVANGAPDRDTINVGANSITSIAGLPHDVVLERVTAEAGPNGGHRGFGLHGVQISLIDCRATGFWEVGRDSQAIWINNGPGPYTIEGGYFEGSGENMMVGGAMPGIMDASGVPSDITVRNAHFFKPLEWKNKPGAVKNLFELKSGKRVLVENCIFENNWKDAQAGSAILIKADAQGLPGETPWMETSDVTFRGNIVKNSPDTYVVNIRGIYVGRPSVRVRNVTFEHNLFVGVSNGIQITGVDGVTVVRNTFLTITGQFLNFYPEAAGTIFKTPLIFSGNVTHEGQYGIKGEGATPGTGTLTMYTELIEFAGNVIERKYTRAYPNPEANTFLAPGTLIGLLDPATYKYPGEAGY